MGALSEKSAASNEKKTTDQKQGEAREGKIIGAVEATVGSESPKSAAPGAQVGETDSPPESPRLLGLQPGAVDKSNTEPTVDLTAPIIEPKDDHIMTRGRYAIFLYCKFLQDIYFLRYSKTTSL